MNGRFKKHASYAGAEGPVVLVIMDGVVLVKTRKVTA